MVRSDKQILAYMESLKSQVQRLEACVQNGQNPQELDAASKAAVLAAAVLDEAVERFTGKKRSTLQPRDKTDSAQSTPTEDFSNEGETA